MIAYQMLSCVYVFFLSHITDLNNPKNALKIYINRWSIKIYLDEKEMLGTRMTKKCQVTCKDDFKR